MRKLGLIVTVLLVYQMGLTQTLERIGMLENRNDTLFVSTNDNSHLVNHRVVTVKIKQGHKVNGIEKNNIRSNKLGYIDIKVPEGFDVEEYVKKLEMTDNFDIVEYNTIGEYCVIPNDPEINKQWFLDKINIYDAWNTTQGNSNTIVAILDSGTDWGHPDLGNGYDGYSNINESLGWNYIANNNNVITDNEHGTLVAGIVGAKSNNSIGIAGISGGNNRQGITMIPFCVGINVPDGSIIDDAIIDAVDAGAKIIQLSLSVGQNNAINAAIEYANNNNVLIVCASGNNYNSAVSYPASHHYVMAVGGTDANNRRVNFSNYGSSLDIVAPGTDIYSTRLDNDYGYSSGTSFAAPQLSCVAALILSIRPDLTGKEVRDVIEQTAQKVGGYSYTTHSDRPNGIWNNEMGYGLVDAHAAVNRAIFGNPTLSGPSLVCSQATYTIDNLPTGARVEWSASNSNLQLISGQGTRSATFRKNGNGSTIIKVNVNGAVVLEKEVWVDPDIGAYSISLNGLVSPEKDKYYTNTSCYFYSLPTGSGHVGIDTSNSFTYQWIVKKKNDSYGGFFDDDYCYDIDIHDFTYWSHLLESGEIRFREPGRYKITLEINLCLCENKSRSFDIFVDVLKRYGEGEYYFLSPNGDGLNDTWEISRARKYLKAASLSSKQMVLESLGHNVAIFNSQGAMIYQKENYMQDQERFSGVGNIGNYRGISLPDGTYFYTITGSIVNSGYIYLKR